MRRNLLARILAAPFVLLLFCTPMTAYASSVPNAVLKASDSVVYIESGVGSDASAGSGFIVYKDQLGTYIATNDHVIATSEDSTFVWISDSFQEKANVVVRSESQDLAILHISVEMDAPALILSENASQGEEVFAIGFPAGADVLSSTVAHVGSEATITSGIVSSIRDSSTADGMSHVTILQISVAINSGNSGGPLLNSKGEVIGINAYGVVDTQGINGAISASDLISLINTYDLFDIPTAHPAMLYILLFAICLGAATAIWLILKASSRRKKKLPLPDYLAALDHPLDCYSAVSLLMPLAQYLKGRHDAGSVCLRLFPARILVSKAGCSLAESKDVPTERFLSPEQRRGELAGVQSDVYLFCAVLGYMLENRLQEPGGEETNPSCLAIRRILEKGLNPSQSERYRTMQELITDLAPLNTGISPDACIPFAPGTKKPKPKQLPAAADAALAAPEDIQAEKKAQNKKKQKVRRLSIAAALLLVVSGLTLFSVFSRNTALEKADAFAFEQAAKIFRRIPLGHILFPQEEKYISAGELVASKQFDKAKIAFKALGNYRKSKAAIDETIYQQGSYELLSGNYEHAAVLFAHIDPYRDSAERAQYARYLLAKEYFSNDNSNEALRILRALIENNYTPAQELFVDICKQTAEEKAADGLYGIAYETLLEAKDYGDVGSLLSLYRDEAYRAGISLYRKGSYIDARAQFRRIGDYEYTEDYLILITIHTKYWVTSAEIQELLRLLDFEDSAELLVSTQDFAKKYLAGTWRGNGYYFTMETDGHIQYNLPYFNYGDYYKIENGVVLTYPRNAPSSTKKLFKITVVSEDCIQVFAYKNNRAYTLYRE